MKNNTDVKNQIRKLFILNLLTVALSIFLILFNLIVAIFFKNNLNVSCIDVILLIAIIILNNLKTTTLKIKPLTDIELENFSEQDLSIRHLLLLKIIDVFKLELVVDEYFSVLIAKYKSIEKIKHPKQSNIIKFDPKGTVIVFEKIEDLFFSDKESNKLKNYRNKKLYNLKYNYLFNFFDDKIEYNGKTIAGASIDIEFQIYYKNEPVYFIWDTKREIDPQCKSIQFRFYDYHSHLVDYELNHFCSVRFNPNSGYSIFANHELLSPLEAKDYRIGITVSNFFIDTFTNSSKCIAEPTEVSQEEFMKILLHNREGFDCSDNFKAQCTSYSWRIIEL